MNILVQTTYDKHFIVVFHSMTSEEFLRLLKTAFLSLDFVRLGVEAKAV